MVPGLVTMQARAVLEAAADRLEAGGDPRPEIMIPLVATAPELVLVRAEIDAVAEAIRTERGLDLPVRIGTMIEVPRAALTADRIAASADFFSFGTNDLTQMTWGFSRDDVESAFFSTYFEHGIFARVAVRVDRRGRRGVLVASAVRLGRETRPDLHLGVCGEHGGDPAVDPLLRAGRPRLRLVLAVPRPRARLEAARARLV